MTYVIPAGSPRGALATAFGIELQKALDARGVSQNELARVVGCGHTAIWHWRFGRTERIVPLIVFRCLRP